MADILNEIKSDIRHEQAVKLIREYGKYAVLVLIGVILLVGGIKWLRYRDYSAAAKSGASLHEALAYLEEKNKKAAEPILDALGKGGSRGYAALARLHAAHLLVEEGKQKEAITLYEDIAFAHKDNLPVHDLARLLATHLRIEQDDIPDPAAIKTGLQALAGEGRPWRFSAREMLALYTLRAGHDSAAARELFLQISSDQTAPSGIRQRSAILLEMLEQ